MICSRLLDLVLPRQCLGCRARGVGLCRDCGAARPSVRYVPGLGMVHCAAGYAGAVGTAIVHFKDRDRRDLLGPLSTLLTLSVARAAAGGGGSQRGGVLVVPVPSSRRAVRDRGGDHMRRLAGRAARGQGLEWAPLLQIRRTVADSAGLTARQRQDNVGGAFGVRAGRFPIRAGAVGGARGTPAGTGAFPGYGATGVGAGGRSVLLVDDIITTGATLVEAARALTDGGYDVIGAAVIAATSRRGAPGPTCDVRR